MKSLFDEKSYNYLPIDQGDQEFTKEWTKIKNFGVVIIDGFHTDSEIAYFLESVNPEAMKMLVIDNNLSFLERKKSEKNLWGIEAEDFDFEATESLDQLILKEEV